MGEGGEPFRWDALVPRIVHPLKVAIIEALVWIDRPLSAAQLTRVFERQYELGLISYHLNKLAELEAVVKVGERPVRGAMEHFYFFPGRNGSVPALSS